MNPRQRFLKACRLETVDRPPVWAMRQAGRYLPEYRAIREKHSFLEMCHTPDLAAEVTLQPLRRFPGLDAGILFSDILVIPEAMGLDVTYPKGGPKIKPPIESMEQVRALKVPDVEKELGYVAEALRVIREQIGEERALLGFSGAPFTIATYMLEEHGKERASALRRLALSDEPTYTALMDVLSDTIIDYLSMQARAGADAIQLFDTWAGEWAPAQYERYILPWHQRIFTALKDLGLPRILYTRQSSGVLPWMLQSGADVLSVDWRIDPAQARALAGPDTALQGNLDPLLLHADPEFIETEVKRIAKGFGPKGHLFNLGHGISPDTPIEGLAAMVKGVERLAQ